MADIQTQLPVKGHLTNNNAAPAASDNIGALTVLANAAAPTWTEGDQVLLSSDLAGNLRVTFSSGTITVQGNLTNNNAAPAANNVGVLPAVANAAAPTWTEGDQVLLSSDLAGNLRVTTGTGVSNVNLTEVGGSAITLGQNTMANSIPVVIASDQSPVSVTMGEVSTGIVASYQTASAVANGSTGTLTYTVTVGKTLYLKQIIASASGGPVRVQVDYGVGPTIICVGFTSTAFPNYDETFAQPIAIPSATTVNIKIMNNAGAAQDIYGTFIGHEV